MSTSTASPLSSLRVVTYNVLSSHLASPDHFTKCDPEHLDASNRLPKVIKKMEREMTNENNPPPIFCLQEVSYSWAGKLHTFFANKNYHFVTALYGKTFNNYMGIGIAFPLDSFEVMDIDISRLSDYREGGWPRLPPEEDSGILLKTVNTMRTTVHKLLIRPIQSILPFSSSDNKEPIDHWELSKNRKNDFIFCRLKMKNTPSNSIICITNYHMPCAFYAPMVMNIHAELAVKRTQTLSMNDPYILAGDFNLLPDSPHYQLITTAKLSKEDVTYPTPKYGMEWKPTIESMRSAYVAFDGEEPDFTNFAQTGENEPFIGTLDYIFISKHWKVQNVLKMKNRSEANGPFPNKDEPSDHVLLWADLEL